MTHHYAVYCCHTFMHTHWSQVTVCLCDICLTCFSCLLRSTESKSWPQRSTRSLKAWQRLMARLNSRMKVSSLSRCSDCLSLYSGQKRNSHFTYNSVECILWPTHPFPHLLFTQRHSFAFLCFFCRLCCMFTVEYVRFVSAYFVIV